MNPIKKTLFPAMALSVAGLLVTSCDRFDSAGGDYEISEIGGDVYLINHKTGETFIKDNDNFIKIPVLYISNDELSPKQTSVAEGSGGLEGKIAFEINYKYFAEGINYELTVGPYGKVGMAGAQDGGGQAPIVFATRAELDTSGCSFGSADEAQENKDQVCATKLRLAEQARNRTWEDFLAGKVASFTVAFLDEDSFQIVDATIPLDGKRTSLVGPDGKTFAYLYKGRVNLSQQDYVSIRSASVWSSNK